MRLVAENLGWRGLVGAVSLEIRPGETFGLIGPNGSGKSTLLRLMAGLLPRPKGRVLLDGTPLTDLSRRQIARRIAMVEQFADTAEALSARDVVALGRIPWLSALQPYGPPDEACVEAALAAVEMTAKAESAWAHLSGGERQRVQIARALAQEPRLLILDEPTNHLDIHHQLSLLRLVGGLPITVVMALHDLNHATGCDRLGVMAGGRLVALGPPAQILTPGLLAEVFGVRATRLCDPEDGAALYRFHPLEPS